MNLIKILTADFQKNEKIFKLIENFYQILQSDHWIKNYVLWELELFKLLGYNLVFENVVEKKIIRDRTQYISKSLTDKKIIPNFLIDQNNEPIDLETLLNGLRIVGDFLDKTILKPNNLTQPLSRLQFINTLK
jgi:DNA repair protein RecO (recombination protein O)